MSEDVTPRVSRRSVLTGGAAAAVGLGVGAGAGVAIAKSGSSDEGGSGKGGSGEGGASHDIVEFRGAHQAGIITPAQDRLYFAAFDVITDDRTELAAMLAKWTEAAERLTRGEEHGRYGATGGPALAPPEDTGEALGLPASALTLTFGFGRSLFLTPDGIDRFGLASRLPEALIELPNFPADLIDRAISDGDLCVQACSNDPQVAFHAVRNLARIGFGTVSLRWSQLGFGRTSSTSTAQDTPRNLFGFKDGTANLKAEESAELDRHLWVQPDDVGADQAWMAGGTYLVARRINMHIETWDRSSLREQETIIGRTKLSGAPLSGGEEFTEPDFAITGRDDAPLIDMASHVALAHPQNNDGVRMLRRGYNFTDGSNDLGRMNAGLFFIAFMRDPVTQYVPMQTTLARDDLLSEYLQHTGSGLYAVPPGLSEGESLGEALLSD
ncbi:MAG TPA: iron uptake transporter deferrochelatase/peroxidase subunit [Microthrixaceae bacterium]|nr:iron uptake transporter deferrochelatase/peroxidase subunit [Microthrixaceae bacterium]